ncbi:MAG: hypothetical protein ABIZ80_24105, partial [Bryobacteraceae bacterium]
LKIFQQFFPRRAAKKVRKQLKRHMDLAAEIRNRDIAIGLLRRGRVPGVAVLIDTLSEERRLAEEKLAALLARRGLQRIHKKWRRKLEVHP